MTRHDASLPSTISAFESGVASRNSRVRRSRSLAIDHAPRIMIEPTIPKWTSPHQPAASFTPRVIAWCVKYPSDQ